MMRDTFPPFSMEDIKVLFRPSPWIVLGAVLVLGGLFVTGKYIEVRGYERTMISVDAEGKVVAVPDIALLEFGVQTGRQKTAQEALQMLSQKMSAVVAALKTQNVADKDITTQSLWLNPSYDYDKDGKRIDRGFEAGQNVQVKIRNLDKIGDILGTAVSKGANQVGGISLTIDDPNILRQRARELLTTVGLEKRMHHFPSQLSGGEQQRVAIVRALMNEPALLLCDEPTGNLDSRTGGEIVALLKTLIRQRSMACFVVTHNEEIARQADRLYHLRDGLIVH